MAAPKPRVVEEIQLAALARPCGRILVVGEGEGMVEWSRSAARATIFCIEQQGDERGRRRWLWIAVEEGKEAPIGQSTWMPKESHEVYNLLSVQAVGDMLAVEPQAEGGIESAEHFQICYCDGDERARRRLMMLHASEAAVERAPEPEVEQAPQPRRTRMLRQRGADRRDR